MRQVIRGSRHPYSVYSCQEMEGSGLQRKADVPKDLGPGSVSHADIVEADDRLSLNHLGLSLTTCQCTEDDTAAAVASSALSGNSGPGPRTMLWHAAPSRQFSRHFLVLIRRSA